MADIATVATSRQPGHDACAPTNFTASQTIVTVNGSPVLVVGDKAGPHGCDDHGTHTPVIAQGSTIVSINGQAVSFDGAAISGCPAAIKVTGGDGLVDIGS